MRWARRWRRAAAVAAPFPDRPVRLVVPYPPGGGADIFARTLSEPLAAQLGQPVIVENRPGANGIIGTDAVARAAPDGYTILLGNSGPNAINQAIYPDLPYDAVDSFEEVSLIGYTTHVLVVHPGVQARSVTELIALARRSPGQLNFASTGQGGTPHLAGELFKLMTGTDMVHVPYKGASPSNADGRDRRAGAADVQHAAAVDDLDQGRQGARAGRHRQAAFATAARGAHHR
ncbi:tripartite tricarboxylate transporter substrate-binding protein [Bordetella pertussis]|uniref:tripartite tricarboxylate transporter substrate-binding protein n=1 Tax=Bordetella pertussis TaxID=520 RepID=UPI0039B78E07